MTPPRCRPRAPLHAALLTIGSVMVACATPPPHRHTVHGAAPNATESGSLRTSSARPRPHEEHSALEADRMALAEARARHTELHRRLKPPIKTSVDAKGSCAGLRVIHRCPLLSRSWRARAAPAGIELLAPMSADQRKLLEANVRCHQSFGRRFDRRPDICPLQDVGINAIVSPTKNGASLRIETSASRVDALRARILQLVGGRLPSPRK